MMDALPVGILSVADTGTIAYANQTMAAMLGRHPRDLVGKHIDLILTVGSKIFYQTHFFPLLRMHGHAQEIFMLLRDVAGEDVGALINAVRHERDGAWVLDCAVMQVRERRKFEDALLRAKSEAENARALAETAAHDLRAANAQLEEQAVELELSQHQLSEQAAELEAQREELQTANNSLLDRAAELDRLRNVAEDANRAKSAFLAAMSHELRTPLNAIGGYVQLLEMGVHGEVTARQRDALERVQRSQRHLLRLINEVLNLARIEAGAVHYDIRRLDVSELLGAVMPMVEPQMGQRGLTAETFLGDALYVRGDKDKVEQVLLNLLGNAVKFTPAGGTVRVRASASDDRRAVHIMIEDTGIGISPEHLRDVFEPFVQVNTTKAGRAEGTGLGLSISRDLARGMGGDLSATSEPGRGSTFQLTLPAG